MGELARLFSQVDAVTFVTISAFVALVALMRKRRPITKSRMLDVSLSAILFVFLGVRCAILAVLTALTPASVLPGADSATVNTFMVLYVAAAALGFFTHRASVGWRAVGVLGLLAVALADAAADAALLSSTVAANLDTALSVATAIGACFLAGYFWTHRTATPNPLGSDRRPFDY